VFELLASEVTVRDKYDEFIDAMCGRDVTVDILQSYAKESVNISEISAKLFNVDECTEQHNVNQETVDVEFAQLHYLDVNIAGVSHVVKSLEDSGAQLCVVRSDIIKGLDVERVGTVKLRGIFGAPVQADLIRMQLKLANRPKEETSYVSVICAVCDGIYEELILNVDAVNRLTASECDNVSVLHDNVLSVTDADNANNDKSDDAYDASIRDKTNEVISTEQVSQVDDSSVNNRALNTKDTITDEQLQVSRANADELRVEQLADETLSNCWSLAKTNKGDFFIRDGILYHRAYALGQTVSQLCLPSKRRAEVLRLAHNVLVPGAAAISPPPPVIFSQVAASRF
jgi:hypothetical protein